MPVKFIVLKSEKNSTASRGIYKGGAYSKHENTTDNYSKLRQTVCKICDKIAKSSCFFAIKYTTAGSDGCGKYQLCFFWPSTDLGGGAPLVRLFLLDNLGKCQVYFYIHLQVMHIWMVRGGGGVCLKRDTRGLW